MLRAAALGSLTVLAVGLFGVVQSLGLPAWREGEPGEGLFPLVVSVLLAVLGAAGLVTGHAEPVAGDERRGRGKVAAYVLALVGYAVLFVHAGHVVATLVVFVGLLRLVEHLSWSRAVAVAGGTALVTYLLFERLLGVRLPGGLL